MIIAFLLIVCILPTSYGALTFPRVMLCSTDSFPQATCTYRTAKGGSFKDCGIYINVTVSVVEDSPTGRRYFSTFINGCSRWILHCLEFRRIDCCFGSLQHHHIWNSHIRRLFYNMSHIDITGRFACGSCSSYWCVRWHSTRTWRLYWNHLPL